MDCVIFDGNQLCYINNIRPLRFYEKYCAGQNMESDDKCYAERLRIAENMENIAIVLNCDVLN